MVQNVIKYEVWVRPKGTLYGFNTHCETLKEAMETYPSIRERKMIAEWWKESTLGF